MESRTHLSGAESPLFEDCYLPPTAASRNDYRKRGSQTVTPLAGMVCGGFPRSTPPLLSGSVQEKYLRHIAGVMGEGLLFHFVYVTLIA